MNCEESMYLKDLLDTWDRLGKEDPLWAMLAHPDKKGNKWKIEEFFKNGEIEIKSIMEHIKTIGINFGKRKALDFGCGVGRLTQSLVDYFDEVYGVDIAPSIIQLARKYNRHESKCKYILNQKNDLKIFPDNNFDFIYTTLTLQHMRPTLSKNYIREFLRTLVPNGLLVFQLPSGPRNLVKKIIGRIFPSVSLNFYRMFKYGYRAPWDLYWIDQKVVLDLLEEINAKVIDIQKSEEQGWESIRYFVTKS